MARFFVAASNIFGGIAYINGKDADHAKVLRLREGEVVTVCDGKGTDYSCRVKSSSPGTVEAEIIGKTPSAGEPDVDVTVFAAWPKGDKAETIVQKTVELGAKRIVFYPSERCVSRPDDASANKKCSRLGRIAEEAAKQCGRGIIPEVRFVSSYDDMLLEASRNELALFFYEEGGESLRDIMSFKPSTVAVVTGPEGGFEPSEAARAADMRFITATLGARILRCETAPAIAVSSVMLLTGNLG
jgi:16S rRNA (uracil1498-N3)-methyltransferase